MRLPLAALALVALLAAAGPADAAKHRKPCARKGSDTVASTRLVRVYEVPNHDGDNNLYGCLRSNDRRQLLARGADDDYVSSSLHSHVAIAGRWVAWQVEDTDISCKADCPPGYDPTTITLYVHNLKARRTKAVPREVVSLGKLGLTSRGALAWTDSNDTDVEVNAFDAAGVRTLDHGDIPPRSLRVKGSTASWTKAGAPFTAELAPRG